MPGEIELGFQRKEPATQSHPRTLISTAYRDGPLYDYWGSNTPHTLLRLSARRFISPGLRFIRQNYGIDDKDYSHFDGKHLVWRHPALSKAKIEGLLDWSFKRLYPRTTFARTIVKHARAHARRVGRWRVLPYLAGSTLKLNLCPFRQLPFLPNGP